MRRQTMLLVKATTTPSCHPYDTFEALVLRCISNKTFRGLFRIAAPVITVMGLAYVYYCGAVVHAMPPCLIHSVTGIWCPGCGSGRALYSLMHGNLLAAMDYNAVLVLSLPAAVYSAVQAYLRVITGRNIIPPVILSPASARALLYLLLGFTFLRNIPFYPLTVLAP
jgi:hypothetical protein